MQDRGKANLILGAEFDSTNFNSLMRCPICKCDSSIVDSIRTINPSSEQKFDLRECSSCRHWWIDPMPTQQHLNISYRSGSPFVVGRIEGESFYLSESLSIPEESVLNDELKLNKDDLTGLTYLEIGIGDGNLFSAFRDKGSVCSGVEPGDTAEGFNNIYRDIADLPRNLKFDVIVCNDVLEHLESPQAFLEIFASVAHSKSRLYCSFPNKSSLRAILGKGSWRMVRPIGHLHFFSNESVRLLFKLAGWKIVDSKKTDLFDLNNINIRNNPIKNLVQILIELLNLGDQLVVKAELDKSTN
jgi:2-polyprenyl-3-methyl-5-hydroxy-6-metoxy-1,4-benzoquinol methylase